MRVEELSLLATQNPVGTSPHYICGLVHFQGPLVAIAISRADQGFYPRLELPNQPLFPTSMKGPLYLPLYLQMIAGYGGRER